MKKVLFAAGAAGVLFVGVLGFAFLTLDPQKLVEEKKDALLRDVSARLGRQLVVGAVGAHVGTTLGATIDDVKLAGPVGDDGQAGPPQLAVARIDVRFSLLRALLSFGKDLHVERFTVDGLVVRAARDANGRWDFQDIVDRNTSTDDAPVGAAPATDVLAGVRIATVQLRNARIELNDALLGRPLIVDALDVTTSDIVGGQSLAVSVVGKLVDGAAASPVDVRVTLATLPGTLVFEPLPDLEIALTLGDVDTGPWGGLVPLSVPAPVAGTVRTAVRASIQKDASVIDVAGTVNVRGLAMRDVLPVVATAAERSGAPRTTPLDLDVKVNARVAPGSTRIQELDVQGSGVAVRGALEQTGAGLAGLKTAAVSAKVDDLARLLAALPPSLRGLPPEVRIEGPLEAAVDKQGAALRANVALDGARVRYVTRDEPGTETVVFDKAAGKALRLSVEGKDDGRSLDIEQLALIVDTIRIGGKIAIPVDAAAPLSADIHSGALSLASLQGLVPPFKDAIGRGQKVEGTVALDVVAQSAGGRQQAQVELAMKAMDVHLASTTVRGDGAIAIKAVPGGDDVALVVTADLDRLSIQKVSDGETALNKPAGLPLRLDVDVKKAKTEATIQSAKLVIGRSAMTGRGRVTDLGGRNERLSLDFGSVDVAFDDLRQALPGAGRLPAGGRLKGALALRGGLATKTMGLDARGLDLTFGRSRIAGDVSVDDLADPRLDVRLATVSLAFDDLRPLSMSMGDLPAGGSFAGSVVVKGDTQKMSTLAVDVKIDRLQAAGSDLKGALKLTNLDAPKFTLETQSDFLDVDALRATFGGGDDRPATKASKAVDDNPHGLSKETRATLAGVSGKATMTAKRARVKGASLSNFKGSLTMTRGVTRFDTLEFGFYGGTVQASGTNLDLPAERTRYDLRVKAKDVDLGAFLSEQSGLGRLFKGRVSPSLEIKGKGLAVGDFALTAEGPAALTFASLQVASLDLLGPIGAAVKKSGKAGGFNAASARESKQGLTLSGFEALTRFVGGKLKLEKPVEADSPLGRIRFEGTTGLDNTLDLKTTLNLSPAMVAKLTGGKVKVKNAVPIPMRIGGSWDKPQVTGVEVDKLLLAIVGDKAGALLDKGKDAAEEAVKGAIGDAVGGLVGGDKKKDKGKGKRKQK